MNYSEKRKLFSIFIQKIPENFFLLQQDLFFNFYHIYETKNCLKYDTFTLFESYNPFRSLDMKTHSSIDD